MSKEFSGNMVNPTRITVAFDKTTADLLEKISTEAQVSQSETMRRALKFYNENKALEDPATKKKIHAYLDMLLTGEHIILDVDHWLMFLRLIAILTRERNVLERTQRSSPRTLGTTKNQGALPRRNAGSA